MLVDGAKTTPHPHLPNHYFQIGIATWTQDLPADEQEESIRRAVYNASGVFSPRGSSEVAVDEIPLFVSACIKHDKISKRELFKLIYRSILSIFRQLF